MAYTFGPVPSRRLGHSLGVDIVPLKTCTYDCVYCQLGRTTHKTLERRAYVETEPVVAEVKEALASTRQIDYITFSGSGEPTLNVHLGAMIRQIKAMTSIPVAVLTNGSLLWLEEVREDLLEADLVVPSLDAASEAAFRRVNRPESGLGLDVVLGGLKRFRKEFAGQIWLEIMQVKELNDDDDEVERMAEIADEIGPDRIQLNTVVRPPAETDALPLSSERLEALLVRFGKRAEIIAPFRKQALVMSQADAKQRTLGLIQRRPATLEDISSALQVHRNEALKYVTALEQEGRIRQRMFGGVRYYESAQG